MSEARIQCGSQAYNVVASSSNVLVSSDGTIATSSNIVTSEHLAGKRELDEKVFYHLRRLHAEGARWFVRENMLARREPMASQAIRHREHVGQHELNSNGIPV